MQCHSLQTITRIKNGLVVVLLLATVLSTACTLSPGARQQEAAHTKLEPELSKFAKIYTDAFRTEDCTFSSVGRNPYFILEPGYQLILEGREKQKGKLHDIRLVITVLNETELVDGIEARVVVEHETRDGQTVEIARNFFAFCAPTNSVFYLGEDVDIYEEGAIVSHDGTWRAGLNGARAGIMMPGTVLSGARYMQEIAPDIAMDRAEILSLDSVTPTPAGSFSKVVIVLETTPLERRIRDFKRYAPGIGLVQSNELRLVQYGFAP